MKKCIDLLKKKIFLAQLNMFVPIIFCSSYLPESSYRTYFRLKLTMNKENSCL